MSKQIIGLHLLAWLVAGLILIVSLFSAASLSSGKSNNASRLTWYWQRPILPDHLIYPFFMLADKIALTTTKDSSARVHMQVNYGHRRLQAAVLLIAKKNPGLALTALTKAQKYLNQAAIEALNPGTASTDKKLVILAIENQKDEIKKLKMSFAELDLGVTDQLARDAEILEEKLINSFK